MRIVTVLAVVMLAAGCASKTTTHTDRSVIRAAAAVQPAGGVGSPARVQAQGDVIDVTLVLTVDQATPLSGGSAPAGYRYTALQLALSNVAGSCSGRFFDGSMPGLAAVDPAGAHLRLVVGSGVASDSLSGGLQAMELFCGESRTGWALAVVPSGDRVAQVVYTPANGGTAAWTVS